ncbi:hypothetical protein PHMEG_00031243, partial [Phytophthora megakarya]
MPNLDVALDQVSGSYGFAKFDLMKGFWQMPLHPDSQELLSFMTEDSVFTLLRVPQDAMDSSVHFQNQLQDGFLGRHNRNALQVGIDWTDRERAAFKEVCRLIASSAPQHFPSDDSDIVVLTDASHGGWGLIVSQEAYPLVNACTDLEYLLQRKKGFRMYTDHANLMYIFNRAMEIKSHVRDKLQRWAVPLCGIRYTIEHIDGTHNVWADMVSSSLAVSVLRPIADPSFEWPLLSDIKGCQRQHAEALRGMHYELQDNIVMVDGKTWIPNGARELLTRLMVIAHCGSHGNRGEDPMTTLLRQRFDIDRVSSKVQRFLQGCLLCKHIKGGKLSFGENTYVLVVKDDLTHYLHAYMRYGKPEVLVSDQGSHFRNEEIELLCARLKVQQSFTPVYSPWINGTIERVNKGVLQVLRALLIEYKLDAKEWPYLLPVVQANINQNAIVAKVDGKAAILSGSVGGNTPSYIKKLHRALVEMHKEVTDRKERKRLQAMVKSRGVACNLDTGDYVLWSRVDKQISRHKLLARWVGPFKVVQHLPNSFMIKHLISGAEYEMHSIRLKFYSDSNLNITEEITEQIANQARLTSIKDSWESAADMQKDVHAKVRDYMERVQDEELGEALG